jgi:hypothetical protein
VELCWIKRGLVVVLGGKYFIRMGGVLVGLALIGTSHKVNAADKGRLPGPPNILLILTDDQGWSQLSKEMHPDFPGSCSGYLSTPNMDRLDHKLFVIWDKSGVIKSRALHDVQSDPAEKQNLSASDLRLVNKSARAHWPPIQAAAER